MLQLIFIVGTEVDAESSEHKKVEMCITPEDHIAMFQQEGQNFQNSLYKILVLPKLYRSEIPTP